MTLDIITAPTLAPLRHGFFSRAGGASSGIFAGLNCGFGSSDQSDIVAINRARVAVAMGVGPAALAGVHQIHSADVVTVTDTSGDAPRADGIVTATPGLALSVLTADCQPILFADHAAGVIGVCHAGWQGALTGVIDNTVAAMERLGARAASIAAVIGPTISQRAYEVGPEFYDRFITTDPAAARFFLAGRDDRLHFDLPAYGLHRLRRAGVGQADWTRHCTYADRARFYSYRRSVHDRDPDYGRLIAAITL